MCRREGTLFRSDKRWGGGGVGGGGWREVRLGSRWANVSITTMNILGKRKNPKTSPDEHW